MRHPESEQVEQEAGRLGMILRERMGGAVLGPDYALVARVRNQYRMQFLIKIARSQDPAAVRTILHEAIDTYLTLAPKKNTRIIVDVDPV
jgi:primosomal protein N' (replication factor Y)